MTNTNTLKSVYLVLVVLSGIFFFASTLIASAETYDVEAEKRMAEQSLEADKKASEAEFEAIKREEEALKKDLEDLDLGKDDDSDLDDVDDLKDLELDEDLIDEVDEHRSRVAEFVQGLRELADKDSGIGEEVREIAKEQEEAKEKVASAIEEVEKRNAFLTFLIGTDYDNVGELRSSIANIENQISRLGKTKEKTTEEVKTGLEEQIKALEEEREQIESFVEENENKFSLFGWFVKIFD